MIKIMIEKSYEIYNSKDFDGVRSSVEQIFARFESCRRLI